MTAATPQLRPMTMDMPRPWSDASAACYRARCSSSVTLDVVTFRMLGEGPAIVNRHRWYSGRRDDDIHARTVGFPGDSDPRRRLQPGPDVYGLPCQRPDTPTDGQRQVRLQPPGSEADRLQPRQVADQRRAGRTAGRRG